MSWPVGLSVNSAVPRDNYQGVYTKTVLPTLSDVLHKVRQYGSHSYMSSIDISRAYSQLRVDPLDWPLQGIVWEGRHYVATSLQFGSRWGAYACQMTQEAICHILNQEGNDVTVYIDDYLLISPTFLQTQTGFTRATELTGELGVDRSVHKDQTPTQTIHWIGYAINTHTMTVSIPLQKILEIVQLLKSWYGKQTATRHQLQKLLGKLHYVSRCCHAARLFLGRMLSTFRAAPMTGHTQLTKDFRLDIQWFTAFLPRYNGIHLIDPPIKNMTLYITLQDKIVYINSINCSYAINVTTQYVHATTHVTMLWALTTFIQLWSSTWQDVKLTVYTPSVKIHALINSGASRDETEMALARQIWLQSAINHFTIRVNVMQCDRPMHSMLIPPELIEKLQQEYVNI
jgi:hypothetical protein